MHELHCPHCSIPLRIRDESYRGRTISCPDCHQPILIEESSQGLIGVAVEQKPSQPKKAKQKLRRGKGATRGNEAAQDNGAAQGKESHLPTPVSQLHHESRQLSTAKWISISVAGVLAGLLLAFIWFGAENEPPHDVATSPHREPDSTEIEPEAPESTPQQPSPESLESLPPDQVVERQLKKLYGWLSKEVSEDHAYPAASDEASPAARSWLTRIAETELPTVRTHWDSGWNAPVNDQFVRRRFPAVDNPLIARKTGDDHYPASHYVGVSGVGTDAAELPKDHPRAGIFGSNRKTKPEDVTDGLSHTILVAGVSKKLGSWARPGTATVRSLTSEPYVNGPDGFGTGQSESMFVLMADGSVRRVNSQIEPVVMRRMAAMADGQALEAPGGSDPIAMKHPLPASPPPAPVKPPPAPMERPIMVELAPDVATVDIRPRLKQKLILFEQTRPVPLKNVVFELQELLGARINISAVPDEIRSQPIALSIHDGTIGDVLEQLSQSTELRYVIRDGEIIFSPK